MEVIQNGMIAENVVLEAATCTQEPGDNCWLHLD